MRQKFLLTCCLFLVSQLAGLFAQEIEPAKLPTHGTINVFLSNKNGLVAVTDSMLTASDGTHPTRPAQKLFQLDGRTICTVAGEYYSPGPIDLDVNVAEIIRGFAEGLKDHPDTSLTQKMTTLAYFLQSTFAFNLTANSTAGKTGAIFPLELTVAGYDEDGLLKIGQVIVLPGKIESTLEFGNNTTESSSIPIWRQPICEIAGMPMANNPTVRAVGNHFVCALAGVKGYAEEILFSPDRYAPGNPTLQRLSLASRKNELDAVSLADLRDVALALEDKTDKGTLLHSNHEVGLEKQIAVLSDGKVSEFVPLPNDDTANKTRAPVLGIVLISHITTDGYRHHLPLIGLLSPTGISTISAWL